MLLEIPVGLKGHLQAATEEQYGRSKAHHDGGAAGQGQGRWRNFKKEEGVPASFPITPHRFDHSFRQ
jgi:hypothetical protein